MSVSNPVWWGAIPVIWLAAAGPGEIDGHAFPTVSPLEIVQVTPDGGDVVFDGKTTRLRAGCNYREIRWYIGERDGPNVPTAVTPQPPKLRPETGEIELAGWRVQLGNAGSIDNTFADVVHRCTAFGIEYPFETVTRFYN